MYVLQSITFQNTQQLSSGTNVAMYVNCILVKHLSNFDS